MSREYVLLACLDDDEIIQRLKMLLVKEALILNYAKSNPLQTSDVWNGTTHMSELVQHQQKVYIREMSSQNLNLRLFSFFNFYQHW